MKILGIDPGTSNLGWGFIELNESGKIHKVDLGCLKVGAKVSLYDRLHLLNVQLGQLMGEAQPDVAVIEKIFLGKSVDSAFKLGHIRGLCVAQCVAHGARVVEYGARTVKKQITGSGAAEKQLVQKFLFQRLNLQNSGHTFDASDALALAFCHVLQDSSRTQFGGAQL